MKTLNLFIIIAFLTIFPFNAKSQILQCGPECLGVWCSVDVNLASTPSLYASYPIPHTPEYFGPMQYNNGYPMYYDPMNITCQGSGSPYITVQGGEAELHLNLKRLKLDATVMAEEQGNNPDYVETMVDFPVQKLYGSFECHYHIRLVVWFNN